jgi:prepilin-type processing-associated H-X9-DG protein
MYALDNKGEMPEDVRQLFPRYISNGSIFKCPADRSIEEPRKIDSDTPISYTYIKGLSGNVRNASRIIILYETSSENYVEKGRNVLFLDGHVEWHSEESFQQLLSQQGALRQ